MLDSEGEAMEHIALPRKPQDDQCPKRGLTSYFLYAKQVREDTKKENPEMKITEIAQAISQKWRALSEEEKEPYNQEALRLRAEYQEKLKEYQGSDAQKAYQIKLDEWKKECDRRKEHARQVLMCYIYTICCHQIVFTKDFCL